MSSASELLHAAVVVKDDITDTLDMVAEFQIRARPGRIWSGVEAVVVQSICAENSIT